MNNHCLFLISVARGAWATPSSNQTERERGWGWGYTLVMPQSMTGHAHTRAHTQESLINQFLREGTRGPEGNHTTQKRARIKSTCSESCYGVVYKRVPVRRKPHIPGAWAQRPFTLLMPPALLCSWPQSTTPLFCHSILLTISSLLLMSCIIITITTIPVIMSSLHWPICMGP